jgi:hypothetical protein
MTALAGWENFYVIMGLAGGALIISGGEGQRRFSTR